VRGHLPLPCKAPCPACGLGRPRPSMPRDAMRAAACLRAPPPLGPRAGRSPGRVLRSRCHRWHPPPPNPRRFSSRPLSPSRLDAVLRAAALQPSALENEWAAYDLLGCAADAGDCDGDGAGGGGGGAAFVPPRAVAPPPLRALHPSASPAAAARGGAAGWGAACRESNGLGFVAALASGRAVLSKALVCTPDGRVEELRGAPDPLGAAVAAAAAPTAAAVQCPGASPPFPAAGEGSGGGGGGGGGGEGRPVYLHWLVSCLVLQAAAGGDLGSGSPGAAALRRDPAALAAAGCRLLRVRLGRVGRTRWGWGCIVASGSGVHSPPQAIPIEPSALEAPPQPAPPNGRGPLHRTQALSHCRSRGLVHRDIKVGRGSTWGPGL
jgi:hypothetical protein